MASDADHILEQQRAAEAAYFSGPNRPTRLQTLIAETMSGVGIHGGKLLEIGGRAHPIGTSFPSFECFHLDLKKTAPDVIVADITNCPEVEDASFDAIVSIDVFEHINRPWLAAKEIIRLLKPGGVSFQSTVFSWRYHPCPIDYWRFTPEAMKFMFEGLDHVLAAFDPTERRRNMVGRGQSKLELDAFGGWRENWRVNYAGVKPRTA